MSSVGNESSYDTVVTSLSWGAIHDFCLDPGGNQMSNPEPLLEVCGG